MAKIFKVVLSTKYLCLRGVCGDWEPNTPLFCNLYETRHPNVISEVCTEIEIRIHPFLTNCIKIGTQMLSLGVYGDWNLYTPHFATCIKIDTQILSQGYVQRLEFGHTPFFNLYENKHPNVVSGVCTKIGIHTYYEQWLFYQITTT